MTKRIAAILLLSLAWAQAQAPTGPVLVRLTDHPGKDWFPLWKPDGSKIVFSSNRNNIPNANDLWEMNPDGSGQRELVRVSVSTPAEWGDSGLISWKEFLGASDEIAMVETQQYHELMRVRLSATRSYPFVRTVWDGNDQLFTLLLFVPGGQNVTHFAYSPRTGDAAWTGYIGPSGHQLRAGPLAEVSGGYTDRAGSRLLELPSSAYGLSYSPDGKWLVVATCWQDCGPASGVDLVAIDARDGRNARLITSDGPRGIMNRHPRWSPRGDWIAFTSDRAASDEIWIIRPDGTDARRITNDQNLNWGPAWSPDGTQLTFATETGGNWDIWLARNVVPPATGTIQVVTNRPEATFQITGPAGYSGRGVSFTQKDAPAGEYTITYGPIAGYTSPRAETRKLEPGGSVTFSGVYLENGSIVIQSNLAAASFTLSPAAAGFPSRGPFPVTRANIAPGAYTVAFQPVAGHLTPSLPTQVLEPGGTLFFTGNYVPVTNRGTIFVNTNHPDARVTILGPVIEGARGLPDTRSGGGRWFALENVPPGDYSIQYGSIRGYLSPPSATFEVKAGGYASLSGTYRRLFVVSFTGFTNGPDPATEYPAGYVPPDSGASAPAMSELADLASGLAAGGKVASKAFASFTYGHGDAYTAPRDDTPHADAEDWLFRQQPTAADRIVLAGQGYGGHRALLFAQRLADLGKSVHTLVPVDPIDWTYCAEQDYLNGCDQSEFVVMKPATVTNLLSFVQRHRGEPLRGYQFVNQPTTTLDAPHVETGREWAVRDAVANTVSKLAEDAAVERVFLLTFADFGESPRDVAEYPAGYDQEGQGMTAILNLVRDTPGLAETRGKAFTFYTFGRGGPLSPPRDEGDHLEAEQWLTSQKPGSEDRVVVMGHSYGGNRARLFAAQLQKLAPPIDVDALVTVDPIDWQKCGRLEWARCQAEPNFGQSGCLQSLVPYLKPEGVDRVLSFLQSKTECLQGYHLFETPGRELDFTAYREVSHGDIDDYPEVQASVVNLLKDLHGRPKSTAQAIQNLRVQNVTTGSVTVAWTTGKEADSVLEVSASAAFDSLLRAVDRSAAKEHVLTVQGLAPGRTHHYRVRSAIAGGRTLESVPASFMTLPVLTDGVPDVRLARQSVVRNGATIVLNLTAANLGAGLARRVRITRASLGAASTSSQPSPMSLGDIPAGEARTLSLVFPGSAGAPGSRVAFQATADYARGESTVAVEISGELLTLP